MAAFADLQPDRRAVLKLLIGRGRGYDQIAELLQLPELVVRRRAHDAITELAGGKGDVDDADRALLCDYLVGELPASRRAEARKLLADSAPARRFARSAAARLSSIEGAQLPELPAEDEEVADALDALDARRERQDEIQNESRRGAWFLVAGFTVVVIAAVVGLSVFAGGGNDDDGDGSASVATPTAAATPTATPAASTSDVLVATLKAPTGGARGEAAMRPVKTGNIAIAVDATGLTPTGRVNPGSEYPFTAHAFWFEGPGVQPLRLGFYSPTPDPATGTTPSDSTLHLGFTLDGSSGPTVTAQDLAKYDRLVVTREVLHSATEQPKTPGKTVLSGGLKQAA